MKITAETTDEEILKEITEIRITKGGEFLAPMIRNLIGICNEREQARILESDKTWQSRFWQKEKEFAGKVEKVKEDLELIENSLYAINSQVVSLRWIGMDKNPTTDEIQALNQALGGAIKGLKECREIFGSLQESSSSPDGVEKARQEHKVSSAALNSADVRPSKEPSGQCNCECHDHGFMCVDCKKKHGKKGK